MSITAEMRHDFLIETVRDADQEVSFACPGVDPGASG